jgi:hypothetical protein
MLLQKLRIAHPFEFNRKRRSMEELSKWKVRYADELLKYFVDQFGVLYGDHHLVYNIHSLSHLDNDCRVHGSLESFSAYPFESFWVLLKDLLDQDIAN